MAFNFGNQNQQQGGLFNPQSQAPAQQPAFNPQPNVGVFNQQPQTPAFNMQPSQPTGGLFNQQQQQMQPQVNTFNLFAPMNGTAVDPAIASSVNALMMSVKNDIDKVIVRLLTEHTSRRDNIMTIFAGVDLKGCLLDVSYKSGISMCPSFTLTKQVNNVGTGNMFGANIGAGLTINGVSVKPMNEHVRDGIVTKMNAIVVSFVDACNYLTKIAGQQSFEIRTNAALVSYISSTGTITLTPSTLVLNQNKNDARKLSNKI